MQEHYTEKFALWVGANQARLNADGIKVRLPAEVAANGTYAEFFAEAGEAMVEIWDYGFSEFHVWLHHGNPQQEEVKMTHHEFQDFGEMYAALEQLVEQMTPLLGVGKRSVRR
jgi:hypothetical protein